jgi:endo-1,4-beta-xylanase
MNFTSPAAKKISRRKFLRETLRLSALSFCSATLAGCGAKLFASEGSVAPDLTGPGLGALAQEQGRFYGAAVQSWQLKDPAFEAALTNEVNMLVPENELKWDQVHPALNHFNFTGYRRIAAFARAKNIALRGHTLLWYRSEPAWLAHALTSRDKAQSILEMHIHTVLKETAPMIRQWDVVNEAVIPQSPREDGLRPSAFLTALGPDYVPLAFRMAHDTDPGLTLVYNDYGLEFSDRGGHRKRQLVLQLLDKCVKDGVPVHALGVQSHLMPSRPLAGKEFTGFLADVRALGLNIFVTELDVDLSGMKGHLRDNIKAAQNYVRVYLDMLQEDGSLDELLTWGLSDRYTWLRDSWPQAAGVLPLDKNMKRGLLWETLRNNWLEE